MRAQRRLLKALPAAAAIYCLYCLALVASQRYMIYPGTMIGPRHGKPPEGTEVVRFSRGGARVEAWFIPAQSPRGALIYAHGNYELIDDNADALLPYRDMGLHVLLVEFPGYGRSSGIPDQEAITALFADGYDWLVREKGVRNGTVLAHGKSLGGGVVCALSRRRKLAGLVLESAFTGMDAMAAKYLVPGFLLRDRYDNLAALGEFRGPVMILHGTGDMVIPYHHGLRLKAAAPGSSFVSFNAGHNDLPRNKRYWNRIREFVSAVSALKGK